MTYDVRNAEPGQAEEILHVVKSDFMRLGFSEPTEISEEEIAALAKDIEREGAPQRLVAMGKNGIAAYLKLGPWSAGNENQFVDNQLEKLMNRARRFGGQTGLFTLAVHDSEPLGYDGLAVEALIDETDLFTLRPGQALKVPVAGVNYPQMRGFKEFLTNHGVEPTGRMGMLAVANVADKAPGELWVKERAA